MKLSEIKIFKYDLPFRNGPVLRGAALERREGYIVRMTSVDGAAGYGEAAPLPGISTETLEEARNQLFSIMGAIMDRNVPDGTEGLNGQYGAWLEGHDISSSVRCALEMAALTMAADQRDITLAELIGHKHDARIAVNGLLIGSTETVVSDARRMLEEGFVSIKLKVGSPDTDEDIRKVLSVKDIITGKASLRLDANRSWGIDEAVRFGKGIGPEGIEYIEEPCGDVSLIPEFYSRTGIPAALDESIKDIETGMINSIDGIKALVIKPMLYGGFERTSRLASEARGEGIETVVSSSFETGLGLTGLMNLAAGISKDIPAGLDTLKWFEKDILTDKLAIKDGCMDTKSVKLDALSINFDLLTEVHP